MNAPTQSPANADAARGPNSDKYFVEYYSTASLSTNTLKRFADVQRKVLALRAAHGLGTEALEVADVGCGAGSQAIQWAAAGHRVSAIDISAPLVEIGRQRAAKRDAAISFAVGSATALPYTDESFDVVLLPELLEHVPEWESCLNEATRVLRRNGVLYLSTTNVLCPHQQEFSLPLYSWYPRWLKKRCERMALTTHKEWVEHASFPAVHWFSFYQLRDFLSVRGLTCLDRFDMTANMSSGSRRMALSLVRGLPPLRFLAHVVTPYTSVFGIKDAD